MPTTEPLSPDKIEQSLSSLTNQKFEFVIKFEKPGMKGNFKGVATNGRAKINGIWEFGHSKEKFVGIGIGDKEWKMENGKWKMGQRTYLTDPVSTIKLICSTGGYKFKSIEKESFVYEFTPNLLFMEPRLLDVSTSGILWINISTGLPEKVVAFGDNIKWEFEVKNIIKEECYILNPLAEPQEIEVKIDSPEACPTIEEIRSVGQILKERLELYGFDDIKYKLNPKDSSIFLIFLSESLSTGLIRDLTRLGKLELYKATYPSDSQYESKETHFVMGDPTKPVFLTEKIECKLLDVNFKAEVGGENIELVFDKELPKDQHIAVVMDGEVIGVVPKVWGNSLKIGGNKITWIKIKLPLPYEVNIKEKGGQGVR